MTGQPLDWEHAEKHLQAVEAAYTAIGSPGYLALTHVIRPLRDRFVAGERTPELHREILEVEL